MNNPIIQNYIQQILPQYPPLTPKKPQGQGQAPVNIALSKYWGKRDCTLNLPTNSSLSISLPGLGTQTQLSWQPQATELKVSLNHQALESDAPFAIRLAQFLAYFKPAEQGHFAVHTLNTVPTAAGLASSASGYAALVLALDDLFNWQLPAQQLSLLARLGSGSAARSLFPGFALWHKGQNANGLDSFAEPIPTIWPEFCIGLLEINLSEKPTSSTAGMQQTVNHCPLYAAWPQKAEQDLAQIAQAIETQNFSDLGATAENNALTMHATMIATQPPILYWQAESVSAMHKIWALRKAGTEVYFTMDAGPNLKLLFLKQDWPKIQAEFPNAKLIEPFKPQA